MRSLPGKLIGALARGCQPGGGRPASWWFGGGLALFAFSWMYLGSVLIHETNLDRLSSDQQYNIELAKDMRDDWFPHRSQGVVNPLWPWLASKFGDPASDSATYLRGRWFNLLLTLGFLLGLALLLRGRWGELPALLCAALGGFGALLGRAVYFQPEPLYYLLSFAAWALMLSTFWRNPWWRFAAIGMLCGLAYLAKSAITPMLGGYLVFALAVAAVALAFRRRPALAMPAGWSPARQLGGVALALLCFAAVVAPRAWYSQQQFGSPFHSWPSYWMWQDDFGSESIPFMAAHPDAAALDAIPPDEVPSLGNYLASHSAAEVRERLLSGMAARFHEFFFHEGDLRERADDKPWKAVLRYRGCYLAALGVLALALLVAAWRARALRGRWLPVAAGALFVLAIGCGYWLAFGWYYRIGRGPRFMLGLFLPLVYALFAACVWLERRLDTAHPLRRLAILPGALGLLALSLAARLGELLVNPHFVD